MGSVLVTYVVGYLLTYLGGRYLVSTLKEEEHAEQVLRGLPYSALVWPILAIGLAGATVGLAMLVIHDVLPNWLKKKGHE